MASGQTWKQKRKDAAAATSQPQDPLATLFNHEGTMTLMKSFGTTVPQLFDYLFIQKHIYDTVCFAPTKQQETERIRSHETYITRDEIHYLIYAYIVKRASVFPLLEAEGYQFQNNYTSATDSAFVYIISALTQNLSAGNLAAHAGNRRLTWDLWENGRILIITPPEVFKAFEIFTAQPLKFQVQERIGTRFGPLEDMVVTFKDVEPKGNWETTWEPMRPSLSRMLHPDSDYEYIYG
jgi:hypothetical protein